MTNRGWAVLGIRMIAVWEAIYLARAVAHFPLDEKGVSRADIVWAAATTVIVVALWRGAEWIASRIFAEEHASEPTSDGLSDDRVLAPAISILGVYVLVQALQNLASEATVLFGYFFGYIGPRSVVGGQPEWAAQLAAGAKVDAAGSLAALLIGVVLVLYAERIAEAAVAVRRAP